MLVAQARIEASDARSSCTSSGDALGTFVAMIESACLAFSRLRLAMMTCAPLAASARHVSRPRPLLAPVTRAVRPCKSGISFVVQRLMQNLLYRQNLKAIYMIAQHHGSSQYRESLKCGYVGVEKK